LIAIFPDYLVTYLIFTQLFIKSLLNIDECFSFKRHRVPNLFT